MPATPAVFLDRDGVIVEEVHYLANADDARLIPGAAEAIARLNRLRIPVVVVTNQAGVARGLFAEEKIGEVHARIQELLKPHGACVDRFYYCPHHPIHGINGYRRDCECRKPRPGMLLQAAAEMNLDLNRSCLIGDKISDLEAGARAGSRTILVRTGYGKKAEGSLGDFSRLNLLAVADNVADAVDIVLEQGSVRDG